MVTESEFLGFAARVIGVSPGDLTLATAYGSIPEWDSIMHIRLVMEFEAEYGIKLPIETIPHLMTLGDFRNCLEN